MAQNTKTDELRDEVYEAFKKGKPVAFKRNPKGLYELYSPDGKSLYTHDYLILKKTGVKMDGKEVLFMNVFQYVPFGESGQPMNSVVDHVRYRLCREYTAKKYEIIFVGADKDMKTIDLSGCLQELTQEIYNSMGNTWLRWRADNIKDKWPRGFLLAARRTRALLKHLGLPRTIPTEYKSLKEIHKKLKPRWAVINEVVRYWMANGMKFKPEDDDYILKATKPIRGAYVALGGESPAIKDLDKEAGIVLLKVIDPNTPLSELPLYVGIEDEAVNEILKKRFTQSEVTHG
jgi:hypothetical protein